MSYVTQLKMQNFESTNRCKDIKIGDMVKVVDNSYHCDMQGREAPQFYCKVGKVIATELNVWKRSQSTQDYMSRMDLLIEFDRGERIFCSSICVKVGTMKWVFD